MKRYYKYNEEELEKISIVETKLNPKGEGTIYIAVEDKSDIKDLFKRKAECKRNEAVLRNFVPPQIFERFVGLNKICATRRKENQGLKMQVRFGSRDLEVLTKYKGSEEPFKTTSLQDFLGDDDIPGYDDTIKWKWNKDRAPRRRVTSSRSSRPVRESKFASRTSCTAGSHPRSSHASQPTGR